MALLLHAIDRSAERPDAPPSGLRGQPLRSVDAAGLRAWATELPRDVTLTKADLLEAHALVSRVGECVPVRLPTWFDDADSLRDLLRGQHEALLVALGEIEGRVELAVTATWTSPAPPPAREMPQRPGARYLRQRQLEFGLSDARRARARELCASVEHSAGSDLMQVQHRLCPSESIALSSALLVARESADTVRERLNLALGQARDVRILINGPWPPYTFAHLMREG